MVPKYKEPEWNFDSADLNNVLKIKESLRWKLYSFDNGSIYGLRATAKKSTKDFTQYQIGQWLNCY